MALAGRIGLDVPSSLIHDVEGLPVFVIERYDRKAGVDGISRLHQEDFCQVVGIAPEFKYESEGGPGFSQCFALVREKSTRPIKDASSLLDWLIFNFLIGNSDAHAKNVSFLLLPQGPVLAPFYDLLSTRIYSSFGVAEGLAMKIGSESDPGAIRRSHWEALATEIGVKPKFVVSRVVTVAGKIEAIRLKHFKETFAAYKCDALYRLNEFIAESCRKAIRILA
jgi:serine/threonine-protein kinase HipA